MNSKMNAIPAKKNIGPFTLLILLLDSRAIQITNTVTEISIFIIGIIRWYLILSNTMSIVSNKYKQMITRF